MSNPIEEQRLASQFSKLGVDISVPGFQDSPAFLAEEARRPEVMDDYARFVEARGYTEEELALAQRKVEVAAEVVAAAVHADGRLGLCTVASGVLSRILDAMGVWNYCAKASMAITFPPSVSLEKRTFYTLDSGDTVAAHAVVVAPPFLIVDATASAQPFDDVAMSAALPKLVLEKEFTPYQWADDDLAAPHVLHALSRQGVSLRSYLRSELPELFENLKALPGRRVAIPGGSLDYVVTGVAGLVETLPEIPEAQYLAGMSPQQLYEERVLPRLNAAGP
ncbi:hypothetical protein [Acidovorax sp. sic0104]|uniref:hypothetical protein n=1 Tax=Acidovorax sp. sic0104 TaxID=2854784 RepID=UPI001C48889A|nr:hypothetical protein [Acidovorax sp. sic0104]MBV7541992.1 hypothetical protein [Acidovorax sp. sic0104]